MAEKTLGDCLKLLRGSSDEQRLAGVLLATQFVSAGDEKAVSQVFDAIGVNFIDRLLQNPSMGMSTNVLSINLDSGDPPQHLKPFCQFCQSLFNFISLNTVHMSFHALKILLQILKIMNE